MRLIVALCVLILSAQSLLAAEGAMMNYLKNSADLGNWMFEQHEKATLKPEQQAGGVLALTVTNKGSESWHIQAYQPSIDLAEGQTYTLRFRAKSDAPRVYACYFGTGAADYHPVSPNFPVETTIDWKSFKFTFKATNVVPGVSRGPLFPLGVQSGTLYLSDVVLEGPKPAAPVSPLPAGYFPFPLHWDDVSGGVITDVSFLNEKPAGRNGYIIPRDGHFIEEKTGNRVRFFGANLGANEAYPTKEDAQLIARRLAKAGVNIVRLHHLDNPWAIQTGGSIWDRKRPDRQQLDPAQLDKLDYLISELKEQGIYVNINLKVSKELSAADGLPASIRDVKFTHQKRIDFFQKRMIELQKDYARKLLSHRNPYTKLTYAEDPAVAVVEINNENSLLGFWTSVLGRDLETLPEPFRTELETLWTDWLKRKYGTDAKLSEAWLAGVDPEGPSILSPASVWVNESQAPAVMTLAPASAAADTAPDLVAELQNVDGTDWHLQAKLEKLNLVEGRLYTVSFKASADRARSIAVGVGKDVEDWHNMGLSQSIKLTPKPSVHVLTFKARDVVAGHARLSFTLGQSVGKVTISNVRLFPGAKGIGLQKGESLTSRVGIPLSASDRQMKDWINFLVDTERDYSDQMRAVLKDELKIHANVALTQIDYGGTTGLNREQKMEFADAHAYWQHPSFPNGDWNPANWTIRNTPQTAAMGERSFGELGTISMTRVAGKPFSVSEYDHPAPSDYVSEMLPTYATFACVQDWDVIYTFATGSYGSASQPDRIKGYFDQINHPAKWCLNPTAALIFRQGLVQPAAASATIRLPAPIWESYSFIGPAWTSLVPQGPIGFLSRRLQVSDQPMAADEKPRIEQQGTPAPSQVRLQKTAGGQAYVAAAPATVAFVGYIGNETLAAGDAQLKTESFGNNYAAVTATAADGQPLRSSKRILVTVCGRVENQGIQWNATRTSIGSKWGHGPTIAQFIPTSLTLSTDAPLKAYVLDSNGKRVKQAKVQFADGKLTLTTDASDAALLYELAD